jgi:PAS domain-containing protein
VHLRDDEHFVQFYEDDLALVDSLAAYVGAGFRAEERVLLFLTPPHREFVDQQLVADGFDLRAFRSSGQYVTLDAAQTLARLMRGGEPDPSLLTQHVKPLLLGNGRDRRKLRVFGEMVSLLAANGNVEAAVQLEHLWNSLIKEHSFSLFCAYSLEAVRGEHGSHRLLNICQAHSHVIPAESYTSQTSTAQRLAAITLLQQKAVTGEAELARRKLAEAALQEEKMRLNFALDLAGLGAWEINFHHDWFNCSLASRAHFGLSTAPPFNTAEFFRSIHPVDRHATEKSLREAIEQGTDYSARFRILDQMGNLQWVAVRGRTLHIGHPRFIGVSQNLSAPAPMSGLA